MSRPLLLPLPKKGTNIPDVGDAIIRFSPLFGDLSWFRRYLQTGPNHHRSTHNWLPNLLTLTPKALASNITKDYPAVQNPTF